MAWYYYSGSTAKPLPDGKGNVVSAIPHKKIELHGTSSQQTKLISRGLLRRTGRPIEKTEIEEVEDAPRLNKKSDMAKAVAEKGVTTSMSMPPRKPVGDAEMTEGEASIVVEKVEQELTDETDDNADGTDGDEKQGDGKNKKARRRRRQTKGSQE